MLVCSIVCEEKVKRLELLGRKSRKLFPIHDKVQSGSNIYFSSTELKLGADT